MVCMYVCCVCMVVHTQHNFVTDNFSIIHCVKAKKSTRENKYVKKVNTSRITAGDA